MNVKFKLVKSIAQFYFVFVLVHLLCERLLQFVFGFGIDDTVDYLDEPVLMRMRSAVNVVTAVAVFHFVKIALRFELFVLGRFRFVNV